MGVISKPVAVVIRIALSVRCPILLIIYLARHDVGMAVVFVMVVLLPITISMTMAVLRLRRRSEQNSG